MAILNNVFVNFGVSGSFEDAKGLGDVSFSGVRNFLNHKWPQMDIGEIQFYNPDVATDETARNRRLTRNQAYWLAQKIAVYVNTLDIPKEEEFQTYGHGSGKLKDIPNSSEDDSEPKPAAMRRALHSVEASLTEVARDHPEWMWPCDHQALVLARDCLKK